MERTGKRIRGGAPEPSARTRCLHVGLLLLARAVALAGCYVVPAQTAYVAPAPVYRWGTDTAGGEDAGRRRSYGWTTRDLARA
jgi:hypothetical protein